MKAYYAHCMSVYGSDQEERDIRTITKLGFEVVNPSSEDIKNEFLEHKAKNPNDYMQYFVDKVCNCDVLFFRATPFGRISSGVYTEISAAITDGMPVLELPSMIQSRMMTVGETRQYLEECGER